MEAAAEEPMDLTDELDPFVLDYLLERGWLTGRELCRVGQVSAPPVCLSPRRWRRFGATTAAWLRQL